MLCWNWMFGPRPLQVSGTPKVGRPCEFDEMVRMALLAFTAFGVQVTMTVALWPLAIGGSVAGILPKRPASVPLMSRLVMLSVVPWVPVLVMTRFLVAVVSTFTPP